MSRSDMMMTDKPYVTYRKSSALGTLFWSVGSVCISIIAGATALGLYGLNVLDRRSRDISDLVREVVSNVPELKAVLPASVVDPFNDRRDPDYLANIEVEVAAVFDKVSQRTRPTLTVVNKGNQVVSLLGMRVVAVDAAGQPVSEQNTYVATPLAIENDWRGPLLPNSERRIALPGLKDRGPITLTWEVTDIRVWSDSDGNKISNNQANMRLPDHTTQPGDEQEELAGWPVPAAAGLGS